MLANSFSTRSPHVSSAACSERSTARTPLRDLCDGLVGAATHRQTITPPHEGDGRTMSRTRRNINQPRRLAIVAAATVGLGATVLAASTATAELMPPASPACLPIRCAADYLGLPVEHLITELDEDAQASGGTPLD